MNLSNGSDTDSFIPSVLLLSSSSGPGGAERMICSLAAALDRTRFRPIVGLFRAGWLKDQCEERGIPTHVLPSGGFLHAEWVKACAALVRREQVAVVHAHEFDANVHGTLAAKLAGTPVVATVHGKHYYWTALRRRVAYRVVSRMATMVAVSHDLKEFLAERVRIDRRRIVVIHNGVGSLPPIAPNEADQCKRELGIPSGAQVIGVVGSLYPVKGHRFLLDALPSVVKRFPRTKLVVVGRGELETELKAQAEALGLGEHVLFLGLRQDVPRLLAIFDIFVLPSLSEGLSMAILEAMTAGRPVVATRVGGNAELIEDGTTGLLVETRNPSALGQALEQLLADEDRATAMGHRGREKALREFSIDRMARRYEDLYAAISAGVSS